MEDLGGRACLALSTCSPLPLRSALKAEPEKSWGLSGRVWMSRGPDKITFPPDLRPRAAQT